MIKIENTQVFGWEAAIRGMRNPLNSWNKIDTVFDGDKWCIGENDLKLMKSLSQAGNDHSKFLRMINVTCDITASLYWWSEYDTYKVGTVANSCSKMHKLLAKPFEMNDFSFDKLPGYKNEVKQFRPDIDESTTCVNDICNDKHKYADKTNIYEEVARPIIDTLNELRDAWFNCDNENDKKIIWYSIIQLLPNSYNQRRTIQLNYQVLKNIYFARKNHKLDEWRGFCNWIESLPYFKEIVIGDN